MSFSRRSLWSRVKAFFSPYPKPMCLDAYLKQVRASKILLTPSSTDYMLLQAKIEFRIKDFIAANGPENIGLKLFEMLEKEFPAKRSKQSRLTKERLLELGIEDRAAALIKALLKAPGGIIFIARETVEAIRNDEAQYQLEVLQVLEASEPPRMM